MNELLFMQTRDGLTLTDGKSGTLTVTEKTPGYQEIVTLIQKGDYSSMTLDQIREKTKVTTDYNYDDGGVKFTFDAKKNDLQLSIDGNPNKMPLSYSFKKRIIDTIKTAEKNPLSKVSMAMFAAFIRRLEANPSFKVVRSLYDFLAANNIPLTNDGYFLAYKKVAYDYTDIHSHTFDNTPNITEARKNYQLGDDIYDLKLPKMPRNEVEDDPEKTCSDGLHVCSKDYLRHYGSHQSNTDRIVICKVDPTNVVSIPLDYNNAKMRVSAYDVVDELTDLDAQLAPYVMGYHKAGWVGEILPKIRTFYTKFWQITDYFNWEGLDIDEDAATPVIVDKFEAAFKEAFNLPDEVSESVDIEDLLDSPLEALTILSLFDENSLVKPEKEDEEDDE
jgi:hypothetical protein